MSMKQLTEIVDWRSVVEWLQKYESEYHRSSFLIGLDLAYDFDCCKVEVFLNRSNISTIFWVELQCCEFVFWGWSATGAFYSRLSPVANSVKIASRCARLVKRPIAAGLSWMMTMNSTELFVSFCCPKLSLNEILVDSFKMSEWLVYLNAWDFVKYDSSKYPCLSVYIYIYICIHIFVHAHTHAHLCHVRIYLRWICHACTVWDIPLPIHIPWTHHACTVRDILQEWRNSRTLKDFVFFNSRPFDTTFDTVPINHDFCPFANGTTNGIGPQKEHAQHCDAE